jgi:hypothetical protein
MKKNPEKIDEKLKKGGKKGMKKGMKMPAGNNPKYLLHSINTTDRRLMCTSDSEVTNLLYNSLTAIYQA